MIGFTFCDVEKEQENTVDVLEDTQNENTEDYGVNSRILCYKSLEEENNDENWKNITSVINKTSLQPVDTNKEKCIDLRKSFGVKQSQLKSKKLYQPKFAQHTKSSSQQKPTDSSRQSNKTTKNNSMLKKYIVNNGKMSVERKQILNKAMNKEISIPSKQMPVDIDCKESVEENRTFEISTIANCSYFENIQKLCTPRLSLDKKEDNSISPTIYKTKAYERDKSLLASSIEKSAKRIKAKEAKLRLEGINQKVNINKHSNILTTSGCKSKADQNSISKCKPTNTTASRNGIVKSNTNNSNIIDNKRKSIIKQIKPIINTSNKLSFRESLSK